MGEVFQELRRRNIFRVAVAYAALSWVILQVAGLIAPALGLPDWSFSLVLFILVIGFPLALIFSWAFELTPEGLKRTADIHPEHSVAPHTGRKLDFVIIGVLSAALLLLVIDRLFLSPAMETVAPSDAAATSIAVLPFVNMSDDPSKAYFSDGIAEEILNVLAKVPGLHVTSRSSAFQYRGNDIHIPTVASQLGVANILEGSVRRSGTRIRITAQLIDALNDRHLWSETYDRELTDIFAIQDEISAAIVDALRGHLGLEAPSVAAVRETDVEAYRLYLLGRHNFEQRTVATITRALELFNQAIAVDPDYAPAYSGKADAYVLLNQYGDLGLEEATALAKPSADRALELDPGLAEAHVSRAMLLYNSQQIEASLREFDRAIELNPNLSRAWHWKAFPQGATMDIHGVLNSYQRAHTLDPMSATIIYNLAFYRILVGQGTKAEELLQRLQMRMHDEGKVHRVKSKIHGISGKWALSYTLAKMAFEEKPIRINSSQLALAQLRLKAFVPASGKVPRTVEIAMNSIVDPATAWADYQELSAVQRKKLIPNIASAAAAMGNYEEVIELIEQPPGFNESFAGPLFSVVFPVYSSAPLLVLARQHNGDMAGAKRLMAVIQDYVNVLKEQGATWTLPVLEAEVHALNGKGDKVIAALEQAEGDGYLTWYWLKEPFFDAVRDREDFQAIVRSVDAKVNEERAKLGWEPVE